MRRDVGLLRCGPRGEGVGLKVKRGWCVSARAAFTGEFPEGRVGGCYVAQVVLKDNIMV